MALSAGPMPLRVTLTDTLERTERGTPYTVYVLRVVHGGSPSHEVERRYSEFRSLHGALARRHPPALPGAAPFPPTRWLSPRSSKVVAERRLALQLLRSICQQLGGQAKAKFTN